jgi:AraC-like DNA-binding protein
MPHIYDRIFENYHILDGENRPVEDSWSEFAEWLELPGCVFQRNDFQLPFDVHTHGVMKPGLFLSIVLEGTGQGGTLDQTRRFRYSENQMLAMAVRKPTPCGGDAPQGAHMRAAGVAFPLASIIRLNLEKEFQALFRQSDQGVFIASLQAPPRIQALATEMLSPTVEGQAGQLLLRAQATEFLARAMYALGHHVKLGSPVDHKRVRIQLTKDLIDSDLRYPWSIAELAKRAGSSRRSFNLRFRAVFGVTAIDYLRSRRLEAAREALVYQNMTVTEAADLVGYTSPANFATAFRKHFGFAPSLCRNRVTA